MLIPDDLTAYFEYERKQINALERSVEELCEHLKECQYVIDIDNGEIIVFFRTKNFSSFNNALNVYVILRKNYTICSNLKLGIKNGFDEIQQTFITKDRVRIRYSFSTESIGTVATYLLEQLTNELMK